MRSNRLGISSSLAILATVVALKGALAEEITTKEQFLAEIVGKRLVQDDSWVIISPDGRVTGKGPGKGDIAGEWTWDQGYYCRKITIDDEPFPRNCQEVTLEGDVVSFIHDKGQGITVSWRLE